MPYHFENRLELSPKAIFLLIFLVFFNISFAEDSINVIEKKGPPNFYCEKSIDNSTKPYYRFSKCASGNKRMSTPEQCVMLRLKVEEEMLDTNRKRPFLSAIDLSDLILEVLNIKFLTEGIDSRQLTVYTVRQIDRGDYIEKKLLFEDEFVGMFNVLMLIPKEQRRNYPAIIVLHGHRESPIHCIRRFELIELVKEGFILIAPSFRAMNKDIKELRATRYLMLNGFTLMGMRVYEFLLVAKYLRYLKEVDYSRIGLLGHSGGSAVANLGVRLSDVIKAKVTDWDSNYLESGHCEEVPALYPYAEDINDEKTLLTTAALKIPYYLGETNDKQHIVEFFIEHLKSDKK